MEMDWNWFFSALAQSTAAIVGIFAAFIITKIISNQSSFRGKQREMANLLLESKNYRSLAGSLHFEWYNSIIRTKQYQVLRQILEEGRTHYGKTEEQKIHQESIKQRLEQHSEAAFSPYDNRSEVAEVLSKMKDAFPKEGYEKAIKIIHGGVLTSAQTCITETKFMPDAGSCSDDTLRAEKDKLDSLRDEIRHHIQRVKLFIQDNSEHPDFSPLVTWSILAALLLFYVGVIYPLSFLPWDSSWPFRLSVLAFFDLLFSFKGILLALISFIFTTIMLVFLRINIRLRLNQEDLEKLEEYTDYSTYSEYLANFFRAQMVTQEDAPESSEVES